MGLTKGNTNIQMPEGEHAPPLRTIRPGRKPILNRLFYGMLFEHQAERVPTVPMQIRISLAQRFLKHKFQESIYQPLTSRMMSEIISHRMNNPTAHVPHMIPSKPPANTGPRMSSYPRTANQGGMNPPRRFTKALGSKPRTFKVRTYTDG